MESQGQEARLRYSRRAGLFRPAPSRSEPGPYARAAPVYNARYDSYDGLPTAAQLQELDWAWSDGAAAVTALNRLLSRTIAVPTRE